MVEIKDDAGKVVKLDSFKKKQAKVVKTIVDLEY